MTQARAWRLALARRIAAAYARQPGVAAAQEVFVADPRAAAGDLAALVEETYDLIEQHVPEVDAEELRRWFRYRRHPWEHEPHAGTETLDA
jgi:hypothetical protein